MSQLEGLKELEIHDAVIRKWLKEWCAVGLSLDRILKGELWRFKAQPNGQPYKSFGQFTRIEYEIHRNDGYDKIAAAVVATALDPGGTKFKRENSVRHFAKSKQIGGTTTVARLRRKIDTMTPLELAQTRNAFQAQLLDPVAEATEERLREVEAAQTQIAKLRRFGWWPDQASASEHLDALADMLAGCI